MSSYGTGYWGSGHWSGEFYRPAVLTDRLLQFVRRDPLLTIVQTLATRTEDLLVLLESIPPAFSIETGEGDQLDRLGEILQRPRYGATDVEYRKLLQIQAQIILSSTGTTAVLLEIVRLFTGVDSPEYYEPFPAAIVIGAITTQPDTLVGLLRRAKPGGVRLQLDVYPQTNVLLVDTITSDVADPGTIDTVGEDEGSAAYPLSALFEVTS